MAITTYAELQSAIGTFLDRSDLTSIAPDFIALAEARINREVRHWRMETRATLSFSSRYTALPDDWIETVRLTMGNASTGYRALAYMPRDEMERFRANNVDTSGVPEFFTLTGGTIEVFPTPSETYASAELLYLAEIPALSGSQTTNWLLTHAPDCYVYGALLHSAPYLHEDARVAVWGDLYVQAVADLNRASDKARTSGPLRMRVPR